MKEANTIGEKIRLLRKKNNLTQQQLADLIGVSAISIRKYEAGSRQPSQTTLRVIADVLGVKPGIFSDLLKLNLMNLDEFLSSNYTFDQKQINLLNSINNSIVKQRIEKILELYGYKLSDSDKNTILIEGNGISLNCTQQDIKDLENNIGFALKLKLAELFNQSTEEGD